MQYEVENKADLCPVCRGTGIYKEYVNYGTSGTLSTERTCHGCGGKGWVIIPSSNTTVTGG